MRHLHLAPLGRGRRLSPTGSRSSETASTSRRARRIAEREAVTLMTGRTIDRMYPDLPALPDAESRSRSRCATAARATSCTASPSTLRRGEILGIGGLAGQGQPRALHDAVRGAEARRGGEISVGGQARRSSASPADAIRRGLGIALVPEDRKTEGLMLPMSVRDNLTLAVLRRSRRRRACRRRRETARRGAWSSDSRSGPARRTAGGRHAVRAATSRRC